jgi:hypothetical protein
LLSAPGLAKHGCLAPESDGAASELVDPLPNFEKGGPEKNHRDSVSSGKKSRNVDVLMEREDDNLLNLGSWSWQLKNLDVSLMPEDNLKTRSTWKNPLSVA